MKSETHPTWYPECKVFYRGQHVLTVGATVPELNVEVWSGSHPFYTGQKTFIDTAGRSPRDGAAIDETARALAGIAEIETHLTLPAQAPPTVLDAWLRREGLGNFLGCHPGDGGGQHRHAEFMRHFA